MTVFNARKISYFPGCSLATSARESNESLKAFFNQYDIDLVDVPDWNCCGSSSVHSINMELGEYLPSRNLALAPPGRPLLAACPSCYLRLRQSRIAIGGDSRARDQYRAMWGKPFDPNLRIITFFELLADLADAGAFENRGNRLKGLKFAPYYGCMLARPPKMRREKNFFGLMEKVLVSLGAEPVRWAHQARCCGTFLSVSRPDIAAASVQKIMDGAFRSGAECIVTACAMCHLNLEIRSKLPGRTPVLYFSELLSLAEGFGPGRGWFSKHLIDPRPLLRARHLMG